MPKHCCDALDEAMSKWDTLADDELILDRTSGEFIRGNRVIMHLWKLTDSHQISRRAGSSAFAYLGFCPFCGTKLREVE